MAAPGSPGPEVEEGLIRLGVASLSQGDAHIFDYPKNSVLVLVTAVSFLKCKNGGELFTWLPSSQRYRLGSGLGSICHSSQLPGS